MKLFRKIALIAAALICAATALCGCGNKSNKIKLYFDGGGGSGNYSTTRNYDTLEKLAKEWNKNNGEYEVVINKVSLNGNRGGITSMLSAHTAPDMLMQVGSVVNDDIGNGWYVDLTPYLDKANPYEAGNTAWKELYGSGDLAAAKASDGKNYYVCLDNIAIGMLYNMDVLKAAGINEVPTNYSEFLACLSALKAAKEAGTITADVYLPSGLWHENYLGTSVYASAIDEWDEDGSRTISSYEAAKSYKAGEWSIDDARFREYLDLCRRKAEYYPENYLGYDVPYKFAKGDLAVTDGVGNTMSTLAKNARFELKITGYPELDSAASAYGGSTVIRGSAGLSSAYWVTNSAIDKGEGAVDACVDFLMYLTATDNNKRLVNDLGYALPVKASESTVELFGGLAAQYAADKANSDTLSWSACYIPELLGTSFNEKYQLAMGDFYEDKTGNKTGDADAVVNELKPHAESGIASLISKYGWTF